MAASAYDFSPDTILPLLEQDLVDIQAFLNSEDNTNLPESIAERHIIPERFMKHSAPKMLGTALKNTQRLIELYEEVYSDEFIIEIDDNAFILLMAFDAYNKVAVLLMNDKRNILTYYRSGSEAGIWRACNAFGKQIDKGSNYVTSSFVDMRLQMFINENYDRLPRIEFEQGKNKLSMCQTADSAFNVNNRDRFYEADGVFRPLRVCTVDTCFTRKGSRNLNITGYLEKLEDEYSQRFLELYNEIYEELSVERPEDTTLKMSAAIIQTISRYMEENFELHQDYCEYLGDYVFDISVDIPFAIHHRFLQHRVTHRNTGDVYNIIVSKYTIDHGRLLPDLKKVTEWKPAFLETPSMHGKEFLYKGNFLINMVPVTSRCNQYGLYTEILDAGPLIGKMFEYSRQCHLGQMTALNEAIKTSRLLATQERDSFMYIFHGYMYKNMWPLSKVDNLYGLCGVEDVHFDTGEVYDPTKESVNLQFIQDTLNSVCILDVESGEQVEQEGGYNHRYNHNKYNYLRLKRGV
jgi:hypothetical protein